MRQQTFDKADREKIDRLKSILQPFSSLSNLSKKTADEDEGPCPLCGGENRFYVKKNGKAFCRQCHERGGDIIDWHCWIDGTDLAGLIKKHGLAGNNGNSRNKTTHQEKDERPLFLQRWEKAAGVSPNPGQLKYLQERKIDAALPFLQKNDLIRFEPDFNILFPGRDTDGNLIACQWKPALKGGDGKYYTGSSGARALYLLPGRECTVITEAPIDAISAKLATDFAAVATFSAATVKKLKSLNLTDPVLFFDNDKAGQEATEKSLEVLPNARVVEWSKAPDRKDISDLSKDGHQHLIHKMITEAKCPTKKESDAEPAGPPAMASLKITTAEWTAAKLTPACIVKNYLYCDVGCITAPGGTGKTTQLLYEMTCIALKRPLYGLDICRSGWCLYITAEDLREILIARLREIAAAMGLTADEQRIVRDNIIIWDVTGEIRPLLKVCDGNIELTSMADDIVSTYRPEPPVLVTFDPAVSFGASERMVNDNGQGLITAARRIVRGLGCCVRFVAHTGIANARNKAVDQYATRGGGSALPDGTRMAAIMQKWNPGDAEKPPPGITYSPESSIMYLSRPKLSYAPPNLPMIWIKRTGWAFEYVPEIKISNEERDKALLNQVSRFIHSEVKEGIYHSKKSLEESMMKLGGLTRSAIRSAIERLIAHGRVVMANLPKEKVQGNWKTYLTTMELAENQKANGELC